MKELKPIISGNQIYLESRTIASLVDKQHYELLKDIRRYTQHLNEGKIPLVDFFLESTYKDSKGEERPCYLLTQKGCEFIANKLTGEKGSLFTAKYIALFHEMKQRLLPSYQIDDPIARAEKWIQEHKEKQKLTKELEYKDDVIISLTKDVDLATKQQRINDIVRRTNSSNKIRERWNLLYKEFDKKYHIDTKKRFENALERGKINRGITRLSYICNNLGMTHELYSVCVKLFEADARAMFENILDLI